MTARLLLDERILGDGHLARTYATFVDGHVQIADDGGPTGRLSVAALDRVMVRYGLPLEERRRSRPDSEALDLGRAAGYDVSGITPSSMQKAATTSCGSVPARSRSR